MEPGSQEGRSSRAALTLAALGVVYGDIGTSPLYAVKQTFDPAHGIALGPENVLGGLSAIFWALMIVVSLKYVILIMRADNKGEGGIMALLALASAAVKDHPQWRSTILLLGVFGASLFYGDAVLTPAISVLSAVEGLEVGTEAFQPYLVPLAIGVVIGLFSIQRKGSSVIGAVFGPVMVLWFGAIAAAGRRRHRPQSRGAARARSQPRGALPDAAWLRLVRGAGRGAARLHRRGGAVRRHGAFRQGADPHRLVRPGVPGAGAQLFRPGRAADRQSRGARQSVLPARAGAGRCIRWWRWRPPPP